MSVYTFLLTSLVEANIECDADKVVACRELIEPLQDAWQRAAARWPSPSPSDPSGNWASRERHARVRSARYRTAG